VVTTILIVPKLEEHYNLSYLVVSLIFLSPLVGYTLSAILNNTIHMRYGQRGCAIIGSSCHMIAYMVLSVHPPYPVLVVVFSIAGFGNGLADGAWNAWIGNMSNSNELLGFLHGFYGLGATLSPLIATTMITKGNLQWYTFYYVMVCIFLNLLIVNWTDRDCVRLELLLLSLRSFLPRSGRRMALSISLRILVRQERARAERRRPLEIRSLSLRLYFSSDTLALKVVPLFLPFKPLLC
jgi:MFS family permease